MAEANRVHFLCHYFFNLKPTGPFKSFYITYLEMGKYKFNTDQRCLEGIMQDQKGQNFFYRSCIVT